MTKIKRQKIIFIIFYGVVIGIFAYLAQIIYNNWQALKTYDFSFQPTFLLLSFVFGAGNVVSLAWIWRIMYLKFEPQTQASQWKFLGIFIYSWIGRYLPGKFWMSFGKIFIGAQFGLNRKKLAVASFFELSLSLTSHLIAALVAFIVLFRFLSDDWQIYFYFFIFLLIICLVALHPGVLSIIFNKILKYFRKETFNVFDFLKYSDIIKLIILYFIPTILISLAFMCLFFSFHGVRLDIGMAIFCSFLLANFLAKLSIIPPAGIGVREGILVGLLVLFLDISAATFMALSSRLLFVFVDICLIIIFQIANKIFGKNNKLNYDVFTRVN